MPAVAVHHTATSDAAWDGGAAEKNLGTGYTLADLKDVFAWVPDGTDPNKADCVMPHHFVGTDGKPGAASTVACSAAIGSLNGARGGTNIPASDKQGVYNHLIAHLKDSGVKETDLPELKAAPRHPRRELRTETPLRLLREHRGGMRGQHERRAQAVPRAQFEFRAKPDGTGGTAFEFRGYAATFEQPFAMWDAWGDPYDEILSAGSCNRTLANGCDTQFLIGHNEASIALARTRSGTMKLAADSTGLDVYVPALDGRSPIVQSLASAMERGDMDEMSIGFVCTQQAWSQDWMTRRVNEISLNRGDVSVVCWAANPNAAGASMVGVPVSEAAARAGAGIERRTPTAPYSAAAGESLECPQCHSMNEPASSYCDQCGTAVKSAATSPQAGEEQTQRCPCGSWNAPDAKFCRDCGTNIASDSDADNGGAGNGPTTAPSLWDWRRPERRGDQGVAPDFSTKPTQNIAGHGDASLVCPNGECQAPNAQDAAYCDQCGTCLYDEGGLIEAGSTDDVVDDSSGLIEEEDMTLARARRMRVLELRGRA